MPKPSLPVRLALLVAGTVLPLIVFAAVLVFDDYERDRKDASVRVIETVRSIRLVLDAEVERMTGGLQVLALTNTLRDGDFDAFRRMSSGFLEQYGKDGILLVADREGRQLFSSTTPDTASLPPRNDREIAAKVFATRTPQYSNLFLGSTDKRPTVTVEVPVFRDGEVIYDISFSPPIEIFHPSSRSSARATTGRSRSSMATASAYHAFPAPKETIGKPASSLLYPEMSHQTEATLQTVSPEGVPLITAFATVAAHRMERGRRRRPGTPWSVRCGTNSRSPARSAPCCF